MIDNDQSAANRCRDPIIAANHRLDIGRIRHADEDDVALGGHLGGRSGEPRSPANQPRCLGFRTGVNDQREFRLKQPGRHWTAHDPQADEPDPVFHPAICAARGAK